MDPVTRGAAVDMIHARPWRGPGTASEVATHLPSRSALCTGTYRHHVSHTDTTYHIPAPRTTYRHHIPTPHTTYQHLAPQLHQIATPHSPTHIHKCPATPLTASIIAYHSCPTGNFPQIPTAKYTAAAAGSCDRARLRVGLKARLLEERVPFV